MAITFYAVSGSPYAWRVWLTLEHKALPYDLKLLSISEKDASKPEYKKINPRGKVPAIIDNGFILTESIAIIQYLDEVYPTSGKGLVFPKDPKDRAIVRKTISEIEGYLGPTIRPLAIAVFMKPDAEWDKTAMAKAQDDLSNEIAWFENSIKGDYLTGELSAADFVLYPFLALLPRFELKKPELTVTNAIGPKLKAWMKRIEALPYFSNTIPPHWKAK